MSGKGGWNNGNLMEIMHLYQEMACKIWQIQNLLLHLYPKCIHYNNEQKCQSQPSIFNIITIVCFVVRVFGAHYYPPILSENGVLNPYLHSLHPV